MDHVCLDS
uniref:Uncharacterized protein n=1 Tax=Rhizophora mucronata TaxID=61149 RepID=A0A2P2NTG3_RHIMU